MSLCSEYLAVCLIFHKCSVLGRIQPNVELGLLCLMLVQIFQVEMLASCLQHLLWERKQTGGL